MTDHPRLDARRLSANVSRGVWIASGVWCLVFGLIAQGILGESGGLTTGGAISCLLAAAVLAAMSAFNARPALGIIGVGAEREVEERSEADDAKSIAALREAALLPLRTQQRFALAGSALSIVLAMALVKTSTGELADTALMAATFACGATLSFAVAVGLFYATKRALEPARQAFTLAIPDPHARAKVIPAMPLRRKAVFALGACAALTSSAAVALTLSHSHASLNALVDENLERILASVERAAGEQPFEDAVDQVLGNAETRAIPVSVALVEEGEEGAESLDAELIERIRVSIASGNLRDAFDAPTTRARVSIRKMADGNTAVAQVSREVFDVAAASPWLSIVLVLLISAGCAWWLSREFADDVRGPVNALALVSEQMARGDLRRMSACESEDELGSLWRSQESMGNAFRDTVRGLADAADRVDTAAAEIESVSGGVAGASADQVRRIQQASELMVSINSQVMEVAGSAQELNIAVEESSSSILELGASGDELNETASVLGSKVDEVSGSIEQMVRSVKQVSSSSDGLADAAAETSASMEEMASAMRAVDTTAELTAELSRNVVGSAESGQQKVSQTIDGMQAIRDATDTAEKVIRGLGARTQEIGAILDVIDDVAEETNLLALNAAIIAAQAGEHGRAFSVVADEIKELADRVLASTKEIGGLIKSVQDESDNAVGAIEVGSRSVASGVELSADAGLSLEEITRSSRESGQRIGEIVSAVREQTKAASHVVALMDTVRDGVTAIVSAAADQDRGNEVVYRSSVTMRDVTTQVRRTTEEQARGFVRIRESVEGVREVVENINRSLQEQSTACSQVAQFLEQVFERTRSNEEAAGSMSQSVQGLIAQAESLRENVSRFQV